MKDMISQISNSSNKISPEKLADTLRNKYANITSTMNVSTPPMQTPLMAPPDITSAVPSIKETTTSLFSPWFLFKIILALIIIGLLGLNVYTYVTHGVDALTYYLGDNDQQLMKNENKELELDNDVADSGEDETAIDLAAEKTAKVAEKQPTELDDVMEKKNNIKPSKDEDDMELENAMVAEIEKKNKNYDANNVSMNAKSKAGYCYVGADRNVRTCVKVGEDDVCMSGDIYPTMDLCVNPNLKD